MEFESPIWVIPRQCPELRKNNQSNKELASRAGEPIGNDMWIGYMGYPRVNQDDQVDIPEPRQHRTASETPEVALDLNFKVQMTRDGFTRQWVELIDRWWCSLLRVRWIKELSVLCYLWEKSTRWSSFREEDPLGSWIGCLSRINLPNGLTSRKLGRELSKIQGWTNTSALKWPSSTQTEYLRERLSCIWRKRRSRLGNIKTSPCHLRKDARDWVI